MFKTIDNCSTIIVGKNASKTGNVLLAHNEDDMNVIEQVHLVPAMDHTEGEVIRYKDGDAVIPQVAHTLAYQWSEFRAIGGEPFADGYVNECGVAVVSNSCVAAKVSEDEEMKKGMGYALRRLIAERAHTAREGVEVAAELVSKYGYRSARAYHIVDKNEGWIFEATTGHNYVAQRVGDDEISYVPNWYTVHGVDFTDTEHKKFYWSEDLVAYPMRHGWYTPAVEGDYSDFDFAKAYQDGGVDIPSNILRSDLAWSQLRGGQPMPYKTFSAKAEKTYGVEDLKKILRSHYVGHEEDLKTDPAMSPHRYGICRDTTSESLVVEFNDVTELTCTWRAFPRPCAVPYTPWFVGIDRLPDGYEWVGALASQVSHFDVDPSELEYHSDRAYWAFHMLENIMEFDYQYCQRSVHGDIAEMEKLWTEQKETVESAYKKLRAVNQKAATALLTDYTCQQAAKSWRWAQDKALELVNSKFKRNMNFWRSKL